jgi:hypothetical protein
MRGWADTERDHVSQLRRATLELCGTVETLASAMELLRNAEGAGALRSRASLVKTNYEVALEQLRSVEAAIVSVNNIADFRGREPDHPGVP